MNPACNQCIHFIPGRYSRTDTCARFVIYKGRGKLLYQWAETARYKEGECGEKGRFFVSRLKKETRSPIIDALNEDS